MPCNSDYLGPSGTEIYYSQVMCLHEELDTGTPVDASSAAWKGLHSKVYSRCRADKKELDEAVSRLCSRLRRVADITQFSLEMQTWWRDHQKADIEREKQEEKERQRKELRRQGLSKLSADEKEAMGLTGDSDDPR